MTYPPKTGPLTRVGFPYDSSPELQGKSEEEAVYRRADCTDAAGGQGGRSDGGQWLQGKRHFGTDTDVVSLEEQVRPDGHGGGSQRCRQTCCNVNLPPVHHIFSNCPSSPQPHVADRHNQVIFRGPFKERLYNASILHISRIDNRAVPLINRISNLKSRR